PVRTAFKRARFGRAERVNVLAGRRDGERARRSDARRHVRGNASVETDVRTRALQRRKGRTSLTADDRERAQLIGLRRDRQALNVGLRDVDRDEFARLKERKKSRCITAQRRERKREREGRSGGDG